MAAREAPNLYIEMFDVFLRKSRKHPDIVNHSDNILSGRLLSNADAKIVIEGWNSEPADQEQARCHIPHHILATVLDGKIDWLASICFECSNVYLGGSNATEAHRIIRGNWNGQTEFQKELDSILI